MSHAKVSSNSFSPVTFSYTYDKLGNILTAARTGYGTTTYTYDQQGQLLSEANTNYGSGTYEYDTFGNLRSKYHNIGEGYTYKYTDGQWRDLLTEVTYTTPAGTTTQTLVYDGCGNPLQYFNGRTYTMTWVNGRELNTAAVGGKTYSYEYDVNGLRTDKTVNGVTHHYTYAGGKLLREAYGNTTLDFLYDANGYPYILNHTVNGVTTTYYYITNPQGDVIRIVNTSGATVVNYYYDAWGQLRHSTDTSSSSIGTLNPLRYRGYYYDNETGFYYLQSRYYDPAICRFINADGYASTGQGFTGYNMFAYCNNSPASSTDPTGHRAMGPAFVYCNDGGTNGNVKEKAAARMPQPVDWIEPAAADYYVPFLALVVGPGLLGTYNELHVLGQGSGYQAHHLIEQRFWVPKSEISYIFPSKGAIPSVLLTPGQHQQYTNLWREEYPYGTINYLQMPADELWKFCQEIYADPVVGGCWLELLASYFE